MLTKFENTEQTARKRLEILCKRKQTVRTRLENLTAQRANRSTETREIKNWEQTARKD